MHANRHALGFFMLWKRTSTARIYIPRGQSAVFSFTGARGLHMNAACQPRIGGALHCLFGGGTQRHLQPYPQAIGPAVELQ